MADTKKYNELLQKVHDLEEENINLSQTVKSSEAILTMSNLMNMAGSFEQQMPLIMNQISKLVDAEKSSLFLMSGRNLSLMFMSHFAENMKENIQLDLKMGLVGTCILNNRIINIANAYDNPYFNPDVDKKTGFRTESVLCVPFSKNGTIAGAIQLINKKNGIFSPEDEKITLQKISVFADIDLTDESAKATATSLISELKDSVNFARGSVYLINIDKSELSPLAAEDVDVKDLHLSIKLGIAGIVAVTGKELIINDAYGDERFNQSTDNKTGFRTKQLLCIPLTNQAGKIVAVLQAINKKTGTFNEKDLKIFKNLAPLLCVYLENFLLFKDHQLQFYSILEVMAASIDAKDPLTATHSQKVSEYATGIARELGFKEEDIDILNVAAWLHDYGKIGIKEAVLTKPGRLTVEEFNHIKEHTINTRTILNKMYFARRYKNVPFIAACHHERLDGKGYNGGLVEEEIPFFSKIIAVADVFDALTAKRHYREALADEKAFEILDNGIGTQFDGNIVAAMKNYREKSVTKIKSALK